jgi:hypothetical protein
MMIVSKKMKNLLTTDYPAWHQNFLRTLCGRQAADRSGLAAPPDVARTNAE